MIDDEMREDLDAEGAIEEELDLLDEDDDTDDEEDEMDGFHEEEGY